MHEGSKVERAAVVSDARGGEYLRRSRGVIDELDAAGVAHRVLFLEADEQTLLTRYKETRRRHPLAPHGSVVDGIARERELLAPMRERADSCIDTTGLSAADAAPQDRRRAARARDAAAGSRSRSPRSATSTARRATPTSRSTSASCRTRTTSPTCAR